MPNLRLLDLFAGAGGMTQGFVASGAFDLIQAVEMDESAAATYGQNHGREHIFVGGIEEWLANNAVPEVDVVIGGPPCQGFSALGKREIQDKRNSLWEQYARVIAKSTPRYFVLENVTQFLESPQFRKFRRWTHAGGMLSNYALQPLVLNAADYGAFQTRRRAVVIGRRRDLGRLTTPAPSHEGKWRTVADAFEGLATRVDYQELPARTLAQNGKELPGSFRSDELHVGRRYEPISRDRFAHIPAGGNRFDLPDHLKAPCWIKHTSGSGDVMGRLKWDEPSVTVRTEFFKPEKGRYLHPDEDRAITHHEAARLQGFPDDYQWVGSKVSIARQIGNAVPVQLASALAGHIVAA
jgi:DNA (cytosine-5)-methyltransferase 1